MAPVRCALNGKISLLLTNDKSMISDKPYIIRLILIEIIEGRFSISESNQRSEDITLFPCSARKKPSIIHIVILKKIANHKKL